MTSSGNDIICFWHLQLLSNERSRITAEPTSFENRGERHESPPPSISPSRGWGHGTSGGLAPRLGAILSEPPGALDRRLCRRRHIRHSGAPDRSMDVRALWPTIHR